MNISLKQTGSIFLPVKGKVSKRENLADWRRTSSCSAAHTCSPGCQQFTNLQTPNTKKSIKHHPLAEEAELRKFRSTGRWFGKEQGLLWPLTLPFSLCICFNKLIVFSSIMVCSRRSLRRLGFSLELKYRNGLEDHLRVLQKLKQQKFSEWKCKQLQGIMESSSLVFFLLSAL